jgi:hypothetical protein
MTTSAGVMRTPYPSSAGTRMRPAGERRPARARRRRAHEQEDLPGAATVALTVLRRALIEGAPVTREAIAHEAAIVFAAEPEEAASRLDSQAQDLGVSALM